MKLGIILVSVLTLTSVTGTETCGKGILSTDTKLPDDELMNAFYIADPDPRTGYPVFDEDPNKRQLDGMTVQMVSSNLSYNTWLYKRHSGQDHLQNLWVYISRMVASDVSDIFGHYNSLQSQSTAKPRGAIDFDKIINTFSKVCQSYDTYKNTWPFLCQPSTFFCSFKEALIEMRNILYFSATDEIKYMGCKINKARPFYLLTMMSDMAVDNTDRSNALKKLFHPNIISSFKKDILLRPLYRSGLVRNSMYVLLSEQDAYIEWLKPQLQGWEKKMDDGCKENTKNELGKSYYCRGRDILYKIRECYTNKKISCVYSSILQVYFETGRFIFDRELKCVEAIKSRTATTITSTVNAMVQKNSASLNSHVNLFTPYLDVTEKACSYEWTKAFSCGSNEQCKIRTMYRPDCILLFLTKPIKNFLTSKGSLGWNDKGVIKAKSFLNILLFYPPYLYDSKLPKAEIDSSIVVLHKEVDKHRNIFNISGFEEIIRYTPPESFLPPWVKRNACFRETIPQVYKPFCLVSSLIDAIQKFLDSIKNSKNKKIRILNPSIDYKSLLEQLQLSRITAFLNKQAQTYFQILSNKISEIPEYLQKNFGAIGNYFGALANYDSRKSLADVSFIQSSLNTFKNKLTPKVQTLSQKIGLLFGLALGTSIADIIQRSVELGLEIAINCNPLKHIFGGSDPASIMDRVNTLTQSVVTMTKIIQIGVRVIPELGRRAQVLKTGFDANADYIRTVKSLVEGLKSDDQNMEAKVKLFLSQYNDYSPKILRSQITSLGAYWETAIDELCGAAFEGGTAAAGAFQIGIASKGDCISMKPLVAEVITIDEEIYDYQFEMMETLAKACRAKYAAKLANNMKITYTSNVKVDMNFLKNNAIISFLVSTLHVWGVVGEYCDILTYNSGGGVPNVCKRAMQLPDENNVAKVISHTQTATCHAGNTARAILLLPTSSTSTNETQINLEKLFKGEEVTFKIPDTQWLLKKNIISRQDIDSSFFVQQFQMFLPLKVNSQSMIQVAVKPSSTNVLKKAGMKFVFPLRGYNTRYRFNSPLCAGKRTWLPYDYCHQLTQVCLSRDGQQIRELQPSLFNRWRIHMTDPDTLPSPKPKTELNLVVSLIYCMKSSSTISKRTLPKMEGVKYATHLTRRNSDLQFCCKENKYWAGTGCQECPAGSTRQLSGYYCQ